MKTKQLAMAVGLAAAITMTAATVFALGPGGGRGYGAGYGPGYAAAAPAVPALTPEQSAKVQKFRAERIAERAKFQGEMAAKRLELQQLYGAPELDKAKIAAKQKELSELQARNREKAQATQLAFLETLTPEQRAQMAASGAGYGGGRGRGMGFGGRW